MRGCEKVQDGGYTCVCIADSLFKAETSRTLQSNYTPIKNK